MIEGKFNTFKLSRCKDYVLFKDVVNFDSQVVWKGTQELGIGCARSSAAPSGPLYVVALYKPAGNIPKLLRKNVFEPGPRGDDPDVYSTLFRRQFEGSKSLRKVKSVGRIQRKSRQLRLIT